MLEKGSVKMIQKGCKEHRPELCNGKEACDSSDRVVDARSNAGMGFASGSHQVDVSGGTVIAIPHRSPGLKPPK